MSDFLSRTFGSAWGYEPRSWQRECFEKFIAELRRFRLVNATPRAGKMPFGAAYAAYLFATNQADLTIVVSPSNQLKKDWTDEMSKVGIELDPNFDRDFGLAPGFRGVSVCYQAIYMFPAAFRTLCAQGRALVIFDEIHHLNDLAGWGPAAVMAFQDTARFILGTTGTAFRGDGLRMGFVTFDANGKLVTDYDYPYRQALRDKIVRAIHFPMWEAQLIRYIQDGEVHEVDFSGDCSPDEWNKALRASVHKDSEFLREMIRSANSQLMSPILRGRSDQSACGIFFGDRIEDLEKIQESIFNPMGVKSLVIHSQKDNPSADIKRANEDHSIEWVLAADMLTEGVGINRSRVGIWGKASTAELEGAQAKGRILPRTKENDKECWWYSPNHPKLRKQALDQMKDVAYILKEEAEARKDRVPGEGSGAGAERPRSTTVILDAKGYEFDRIINGEPSCADELGAASKLLGEAGLEGEVSQESAIRLMKAAGLLTKTASPSVPMAAAATAKPATPMKTLAARREEESKKCWGLVNSAARILKSQGEFADTGEAVKWVRANILTPLDGIHKDAKKRCSPEQLERRTQRMEEYIQELTANVYPVG